MGARLIPRLALLLISVTFPAVAGAVRAAATAPQRDPNAVVAVERTVTALGGLTAVGQITDATVTGTIQPASGSSLTAGKFKWEDAPPEFRYSLQTGAETRVFASGHGRSAPTGPRTQAAASTTPPGSLIGPTAR